MEFEKEEKKVKEKEERMEKQREKGKEEKRSGQFVTLLVRLRESENLQKTEMQREMEMEK